MANPPGWGRLLKKKSPLLFTVEGMILSMVRITLKREYVLGEALFVKKASYSISSMKEMILPPLIPHQFSQRFALFHSQLVGRIAHRGKGDGIHMVRDT